MADDFTNPELLQLVAQSGGSATDPAQIVIEPDATIGLEADDVDEAIDELAADIHAMNNMQDLAGLFQNSLI